MLAKSGGAALDAQTRNDVNCATHAELRAILDGQLEVHELRAQRALLATYAEIAKVQRLNAADGANREAAQALQDDFDARLEEEAKLRQAEKQDEKADQVALASAMRHLDCFSVGNAAWTQADTPRLLHKLRDAEAQSQQRRPPPDFVQLIREPASRAVVEAVTWRFENDAWRAQQRPKVERDFLQVAFISDMHGAHGMLDKYMSMPEIAEADCLCICGDVFEHETGASKLEHMRPMPERDLAKWLRAQPQRFKIVVSGNHDVCFALSEALALQGVPPPFAGEPGRQYLRGRESPCIYLQDEAAVITLANGEEVIIYGTPWHPLCGGLFEYDTATYGDATPKAANPSPYWQLIEPAPGIVGSKLQGSWGAVGDRAHIVLCHGPPEGILDSVACDKPKVRDLKKLTAAEAEMEMRKFLAGESVGCGMMRERLRKVQPAVMAFGHVHANQGLRGKQWSTSKEGKAWNKAVKDARDGKGKGPEQKEPAARWRRIAWGHDLSDVAAAVVLPTPELRKLHADLQGTLFVNAANLNAIISGVQHGVRPEKGEAVLDSKAKGPGKTAAATDEGEEPDRPRVHDLRPPIVVRVFPGARGERRKPELLKLNGNPRFPEE